jgi:hypothetical protein
MSRKLEPDEISFGMVEGQSYSLFASNNRLCFTDIFERYVYYNGTASAEFKTKIDDVYSLKMNIFHKDYTSGDFYYIAED